MNKALILLAGISGLLLIACQQDKPSPKSRVSPVAEMANAGILQDFPLESLVSMKDTICGMSLKDGVADTLSWQGNIYGFCHPGCKKAFLAKIPS